jgi:alpha 1,2-mannosyltransferase
LTVLIQTNRSHHGENFDFSNFGNALFDALKGNEPGEGAIQRIDDAPALVFWKTNDETIRPDLVNMTSASVARMRHAHAAYLNQARHIALPFDKRTSGIVSAAAGKYLPVFVISLRMLRRTACQLPVELFVDSEVEVQSHLCQTILPRMNTRCLRLQDRLGTWSRDLATFQLKAFAILASSFENVLFLDADAFMAKDPSNIFAQAPFASTGLITWPDFWASSASRHLYHIIEQPVPAMNALPSTESGQLVVSKSKHRLTLLLAAYYNFYGPHSYYPLISQGAPGQGDKDTFVTAARVARLAFHQVVKCVDTIGYYEDGRYHGGAMLQYDPSASPSEITPSPFSVHHNIPKYDPVQLFELGVLIHAKTGVPHRLLGTRAETEKRFGRDVEAELWQEIEHVACELAHYIVGWSLVSSTAEKRGTCDMVRWYRDIVFA